MFFVVAISSLALNRILGKKLGKDWVAHRFVYWGIQALVAFYMARDLRNRKKHGERLVKEQDRDTKKYMSIRI